MPHKFVSDKRKTFKAAAKFMKAVFKDDGGTGASIRPRRGVEV